MAIVIKKRVSLEFLGEEYREAYLVFRAIPAIDFDEVGTRLNEVEKDNASSVKIVLDVLKTYFLSGKFPDDAGLTDVNKEDLDGLDPISLTKCFQIFTGQEIDPKDGTLLTSSLPMADTPPESS